MQTGWKSDIVLHGAVGLGVCWVLKQLCRWLMAERAERRVWWPDMADGMAGGQLVPPVGSGTDRNSDDPSLGAESGSARPSEEGKPEEALMQDLCAWADMLPEALAAIFSRLSFEELMNVVPLVCKSWRRAALDPSCWQVVDLSSWSKKEWSKTDKDRTGTVDRMVRLVVDRSCGGLQELIVTNVGSDDSIRYVATRCAHLRKLFIPNSPISDGCFFDEEVKFPALMQLNISHCQVLSEVALENIGKKAGNLLDLRRRMRGGSDVSSESEALAIAQNMSKLQHLELKYGQFSNTGLLAILESCKDLQYLDVRNCGKLIMDEELQGKVKKLKTWLFKTHRDVYEDDDLDDDDDDDDVGDPWDSYDDRYDEIWLSDLEEWCMASQLDSDGDVFDEMFMVDDMFADEYDGWSP